MQINGPGILQFSQKLNDKWDRMEQDICTTLKFGRYSEL